MTIQEQAFAGLPLDIPVIDAHTHINCDYEKGWHQNPEFTSLESFVQMQDALGINCSVTSPHALIDGMTELTNRRAAEAAERFPGRIYGYINIAPFDGMDICKKNIETYAKNPAFVGFKFLGGYHGNYTEPEYEYAMDFANEAGCPVLCHTWSDKPAITTMVAMAEKRPDMTLLMAHQGGGSKLRTHQAALFVRDMPNVYMELCGSLYNPLSFADIAELVGEDKMIFGTDAINLDVRFDFGRLAFSSLSDDAKKKIFAENFLHILEKSQMGKITL